MNKVSLASSVGALLGGLLIASSAIAQGISNDKQGIPNENVTVVAPYITHETQTNLGVGNRGIYDVNSLTKEVSYADLDLSKSSDDDRFFQRINDTAKEACADLGARYWRAVPILRQGRPVRACAMSCRASPYAARRSSC